MNRGLIEKELKHHAPFTLLGALAGVIIAFLFRNISYSVSYKIFYVLHPMHVVLSALVTSAVFKKHKCPANPHKCPMFTLIAVGYIGSIGIATLSDSVIPYLGEAILNLPHKEAHIGFIEHWQIIAPAALIGIALGYFSPKTTFPHAGHVLLSTGASLFHVLMALGGEYSPGIFAGIFVFLFLSVWVPCCVSDIVFPLLFISVKNERASEE